MKIFEGLGKKLVLYEVTVVANSKTEAIKKIRAGDVASVTEVHKPKHFTLGGAGHDGVKEKT